MPPIPPDIHHPDPLPDPRPGPAALPAPVPAAPSLDGKPLTRALTNRFDVMANHP
ncbi:hypothetical protein GCM10017559_14390 [Streptosporangium longisporum]|uniref:Uncharacterized protein n=1 Tax=Streptosporangium longisporum TaxID=46187 RepID=A0ABP6KD97_9ACTN